MKILQPISKHSHTMQCFNYPTAVRYSNRWKIKIVGSQTFLPVFLLFAQMPLVVIYLNTDHGGYNLTHFIWPHIVSVNQL